MRSFVTSILRLSFEIGKKLASSCWGWPACSLWDHLLAQRQTPSIGTTQGGEKEPGSGQLFLVREVSQKLFSLHHLQNHQFYQHHHCHHHYRTSLVSIFSFPYNELRYESSTLILYKELSSSIFQSCQWVSGSGIRDTCPDLHFVQYIKA